MNLLQSRPWNRFKLCTSCSATWEVDRIDKPSNSKSKLLKKLLTNRIQLTYTIWRIWTHLFSLRTWICDLSDCAGSSYPSPQFSSLACGCIYSYFCERWELPWELLFGTCVKYVVKGCRSLNEWFVPTTPRFDCWFADCELMQCVLITWVSHWHSHTLIHTCGQFRVTNLPNFQNKFQLLTTIIVGFCNLHHTAALFLLSRKQLKKFFFFLVERSVTAVFFFEGNQPRAIFWHRTPAPIRK